MKLQLHRPLIFLDLETTGTNAKADKIVQLAVKRFNLDGSTDLKTILIDPEIPIPKEASDVHRITDEMVIGRPKFREVAKAISEFCFGSDLAGFNSNRFDIPMLMAEFDRTKYKFLDWEFNLLDVRLIHTKIKPQTLSDVYRDYFGKELEGAHDAQADNEATIEILFEQIDRYKKVLLEMVGEEKDFLTVEDLDLLVQGDKRRFDINGSLYVKNDVIHWNLPKYKDKPLDLKAHYDYITWILKQPDFPSETKDKLKALITPKLDTQEESTLI